MYLLLQLLLFPFDGIAPFICLLFTKIAVVKAKASFALWTQFSNAINRRGILKTRITETHISLHTKMNKRENRNIKLQHLKSIVAAGALLTRERAGKGKGKIRCNYLSGIYIVYKHSHRSGQ